MHSDKAIVGKNKFLFLGGADSNGIESFILGSERISDVAIRIWKQNIANIRGSGLDIVGIVVPEAHVVYSEMLPEHHSVQQRRPVIDLDAVIRPHFEYIENDLRLAKMLGICVYTGKDSHWTEPAAMFAWLGQRRRLNVLDSFRPGYPPSADKESGDLLHPDGQQVRERERSLRKWPSFSGTLVLDTGIRNRGFWALYVNKSARGGRLLVFGTSFSERLIPFYMEDFREVIFIYGTSVDWTITEVYKPDKIFIEMPERFVHFPAVDSDCDSAWLAAWARGYAAKLPNMDVLNQLSARKENLERIVDYLNSAGDAINSAQRSVVDMLNGNAELLSLFFGNFRNENIMYKAFDAVDKGLITAAMLRYIPDSEMGLLTKIRLCIRENDLDDARTYFRSLASIAPNSTEFSYFDRILNS